ncbi:MAG: hypothetical protein IPO37_09855 [Saprospiraceae bacterium]|nr:hypothetical protein [Saprospiraceae bacterium]
MKNKRLQKYTFSLITLIIFNSCVPKGYQKSNIWFGGYRLLDINDISSAVPLKKNAIMVNDTTLVPIMNGVNKNDEQIVTSKTIFFVKNDILIVNNEYFFMNLIDDKNILYDPIMKGCWHNNDYHVCITDSTIQILNKITNDFKHKCFTIEKLSNSTILNLFGNKFSCDKNYNYFKFQILKQTENVLYLRGFIDQSFKDLKLQKTYKTIKEKNDFHLCDDLMYLNKPSYRYYTRNTSYKGGTYHIKKIFKNKYKIPVEVKESGMIRIRFIVNCQGKAGRFEMLEIDNNYCVKSFNPAISNQILNICMDLKEWIPGTKDKQNVDSYIFLTFRIKDSEIIEIYP